MMLRPNDSWSTCILQGIATFLHYASRRSTGFRQGGTRALGENMGQLDQTLGPPQVAEIRIGKLRDGPIRGIEEVAHVCFLVEHDVKVENRCPS